MDHDLLTADYRLSEKALPVLRLIKHTRLEGAIVEHEVEQVLLPAFIEAGWRAVDALVLRRYAKNGAHEIDVLSDDDAVVTEQLLSALRRTGLPVRRLAIQNGELMLLDDQAGKALERPVAIAPGPFSDGPLTSQLTDPQSISEQRTLSTFWGFAAHLEERAANLVESFVIKDFYIGPKSNGLWDLDRFLVSPTGQLVYIETKHKYPIPRSLRFGMNVGEVEQMRLLAEAGIVPWHVILVKPRWDKSLSSMYLFFDRKARERALWIASDLSSAGAVVGGTHGVARRETSIYGRQGVSFVELALESFFLLGQNSEPAAVLSQRFRKLVEGDRSMPHVTAGVLQDARLA